MEIFSKLFESALLVVSVWLFYVAVTDGPLWLAIVGLCTGALSVATLLHIATGKHNSLSKRPSWWRRDT